MGTYSNGKKIILVIEDDKILLDFYKNMFSLNGINVFFAKDGEQGLKMINEINPDVVVLDILMPKLDGVEILKRMRADEKTKSIPVLILTNYENYRDKVEPYGVVDYLIKSDTEAKEVVRRVLEVLRGRLG